MNRFGEQSVLIHIEYAVRIALASCTAILVHIRALFLPEAASQPGGAKLVNRFGGAVLYVEYVVRLAGVSCTFVAPSAFQLLCGTGSLVFVYAKFAEHGA